MGRHKKYHSEKEKTDARKKRQMEYYWRNQDIIKKKNLKRYHERKK